MSIKESKFWTIFAKDPEDSGYEINFRTFSLAIKRARSVCVSILSSVRNCRFCFPFSADVTKGSRSASTSISLTVVEGRPPAVWVDLAEITTVANERVTLEGFYKTSLQPSKVEWKCVEESGT